jgi:hypothetical protein
MKLTEPQKSELRRLVRMKLLPSYVRNEFPGFPIQHLDMRSIAALERRGLVECITHRWRPPGCDNDRIALTYRPTDAGRQVLDDVE